jgi:hypothetical protein
VIRIAAATLCLSLVACGNLPSRMPFGMFDGHSPQPLDFDQLESNPGVYAGQAITLVGTLSEAGGQACLADRNRRVAVRLTAEQAALWRDARDWPVAVEGVFQQHLCPPGLACPEFCTPYGLDAGARVTSLESGR